MAASVGVRKPLGMGGELFRWKITGGAGANVTITHNFGRVPEVWTVPKGQSSSVCPVISKSTTTIVVYVDNGSEADVFAYLPGA